MASDLRSSGWAIGVVPPTANPFLPPQLNPVATQPMRGHSDRQYGGFVPAAQILGERIFQFGNAPSVVFSALLDEGEHGEWLKQAPGEVKPAVLSAVEVTGLVWSSLWPVSPDDTIEFELSPNLAGTVLRFRWLTTRPPDHRGVAITRQRLNRYFGSDLRGWVDSP